MKMGQFREVDPEEQKKQEEEKARKAAEEKAKADSLKIGDRWVLYFMIFSPDVSVFTSITGLKPYLL